MKGLKLGRSLLVSVGLLVFAGDAAAWGFLTYKWAPGPNTAQPIAGNVGTPGGATWSIMGAGLPITYPGDTHGGATTTNFGALIGGSSDVEEKAAINAAINTWAAVCGFTNLGLVADGGAAGGALQAVNGHLGDIRFGALGSGFGSGVLAHAFEPGTEAAWGVGGTAGGDVHFNTAYQWVDDPFAGSGVYDFQTVALHELGHSLGLDHSTVLGSVMYPYYGGARRTLTADDIQGIQTLYGPVPEPATMVLAGAALLAGMRRRKGRTA